MPECEAPASTMAPLGRGDGGGMQRDRAAGPHGAGGPLVDVHQDVGDQGAFRQCLVDRLVVERHAETGGGCLLPGVAGRVSLVGSGLDPDPVARAIGEVVGTHVDQQVVERVDDGSVG